MCYTYQKVPKNRKEKNKLMKIENNYYCLEIDSQNGVINSFFDKIGNFELIVEPRLADNFRLLLPLPGAKPVFATESNYIFGKEQRLTSVEQTANGMTLRWNGPLTNQRGDFDLDVVMRIELVGNQVQFRINVHNRTEYKVAEVWYPILGGTMGIGGEADERRSTKAMIPSGFSQWNPDMFTHFGRSIDLGTPVPEHSFSYPGRMSMPWAVLYNPKVNRGMYFASHDTVPRFKVVHFEMHPGNANGRPLSDWPRSEELNGLPMGVILNWVSFPYTKHGESFDGPPVVVQFHEGDWYQGAMIYRDWFTSNFTLTDSHKSWMRQETTYQDTMFLLPEGNVNFTFKDIPQWAKDALGYSVKAVLISGWHWGGHDNGYPHYEPDPRLGTWEELAAGIRECHKMGVKVFFFVNLQPVDIDTEWYQKELHQYRSMDPWGCKYGPYGWGMGTLGARIGLTRRPLASVSPGFPEFREIIVRQIKKLAEIGADGVHIDKFMAVGLDFNPELKTSPDKASWEGMLQFLDEMMTACKAVNSDFCISVESNWDRTLSYTDVVWWSPGVHSVIKATFPQWVPCVGVNQPYDYNVVNNAVLLGHNLLVGPAHYTSSMAYKPMRQLSAYIKEITRMRGELIDTVSLGEFLDTSQVHLEGQFVADGLARRSVFRNIQTGKRACVLVNLGVIPLEASVVAFEENNEGKVRIYQPFEECKNANLPVTVMVPPERLVIVVEE
jgi:hypothetical protein